MPVFILSVIVSRHSSGSVEQFKRFGSRFFRNGYAVVAVPILLVLVVYAVLPPQHGDSPGYHFLSIRWNEEYRVIPGLANLHGRLGFNSSFFVSSAAFAFSRLAGQHLYVLNIAVVIAYYLWVINKIYNYKSSLWSLVFLIICVAMFRQLIDSISSPTPDVVSSVIISYVFIAIAEKLLTTNEIDVNSTLVLLLIICFGFTIKLNTFPLSFIGLFLFIKTRMYKNKKAMSVLVIGGLVILVPWVIRNYIISGYLVFPVAATGFLHPDWQVPFRILHFEKLLINNGPKLISQDWEALDRLTFLQWFPLWIKAHFTNGLAFSLVILIIAVVCIITTLVVIRKKGSSLLWLTLTNAACILFWIYNSPDYRFGYPYLVNAISLLALILTSNKALGANLKLLACTLTVILCGYYIAHAVTLLSPHPVVSFVTRPLTVPQNEGKSPANFPFIVLGNKIRLYVEDSSHWCNMADLPCLIPYGDSFPTHQIKLRGTRVEEGFRIVEK